MPTAAEASTPRRQVIGGRSPRHRAASGLDDADDAGAQLMPPTSSPPVSRGIARADEESMCTTVFDDEHPYLSRGLLEGTPGRGGVGGDAEDDDHRGTLGIAACCSACCTKLREFAPAIRVGIFVFLMAIPVILCKPVLIEVKKRHFGSDKQAALIGSIVDCVTAVVNLFTAVLFGKLIDAIGRRPMFIAAAAFAVLQFAMLVVWPENPVGYMVVGAVGTVIQGSYIYAYLADVAAPERRAHFFAVVGAVSSFVLIFGLFTALADTSDRTTFAIATGCAGAALLYAIAFIPESLPPEQRTPIVADRSTVNPLYGISVMFRSRVLILCSVVLVVVKIADIGIGEVYAFYLNERVGFNKKDFGFLYAEVAVIAPVCLLGLMPLLLRYISPPLVMCVALIANAMVAVMIATIWAKWPVFAFATPVAGVMMMLSPIIKGIVTNAGAEDEVAKRLTALTAVGDLCSAVGPLPFGVAYSQLNGGLEAIPFFVSGALCLAAAFVATRITAAVSNDAAQEVVDEVAAADDDDDAGEAAYSDDAVAARALGGGLQATPASGRLLGTGVDKAMLASEIALRTEERLLAASFVEPPAAVLRHRAASRIASGRGLSSRRFKPPRHAEDVDDDRQP